MDNNTMVAVHVQPEGMTDELMAKLRSALRFAASRSVMSSADEQAALAALTEAADEIASLRARVESYREALVDLMSWFPNQPSNPEWRIKGGVFGADDAVEHARSLVEKELDT